MKDEIVVDVEEVSGKNRLAEVREAPLICSAIKPIKRFIDCDADPFIPNGWTVEEHRKDGQVKWSESLVELYFSEKQKDKNCIKGDELRKELAKKSVLNACVLDFLLANPHLVPEKWQKKYVFFWGTVYSGSSGHLYVRCLRSCPSNGRWRWTYNWLGFKWDSNNAAAIFVNI